MDLFKTLDDNGIDTHNLYVAIESVTTLPNGATDCRRIITELSDNPAPEMSDLEAQWTLKFMVKQVFNADVEVNADEAQLEAMMLIDSRPWMKAKPDSDNDLGNGDGADSKVNDDGVEVGKGGKPKKGYKKNMALDLWRANPEGLVRTDRKAWIKTFVEKISDMNPQVANTYLSNIERGKWV